MADFIKLGADLQNASALAINRAAQMSVTALSKFIRQTYNIKKSDLDKQIVMTGKADAGRQYATVRIKRGEIGLIKFGAKQIGKGGRRTGRRGPRLEEGVRAEVRKGERRLYRSAAAGYFVATMKSGKDGESEHVGVYVREVGNKLKERWGVDIMQRIITKSGDSQAVVLLRKTFAENYEKRLQHETKRLLG